MSRTQLESLTAYVGCSFFLASVIFFANPALAVPVQQAISVSVSTADDTASWSDVATISSDGQMHWASTSVNMYGSAHGQLLAHFDGLTVDSDNDPFVSLGFSVTAGGALTNFTITSTTVSFAPILNPLAFALASVTIADNDSNGATLTGLFPGSHAYQAQYNTLSGVFANLDATLSSPPDMPNSESERYPLVGRVPILAAVSDIESQFKFTLTANDSASGTSTFNIIVPEPSTVVLALLGGVALLWQARRRR